MNATARLRAVLAAALLPGVAWPAAAQALKIVPTLAVEERYSDNRALAPDESAQGGWITDLAPGIRLDHVGARSLAHLDFRLHHAAYHGERRLDTTQRYLDSAARFEAIEDRLFLDAAARRTQQALSPFGAAVAPDGTSVAENRVETSVWQFGPAFRGELRDIAAYRARWVESDVSTAGDVVPGLRVTERTLQFLTPSPSARLGWSVDASALTVRSDTLGTLDNTRARASVYIEVVPQLRLAVSHGRERTEFAGPARVDESTPGVGLSWFPSVRTQLAATYERRFFGRGHEVSFTHRTPRTAWRLRSIRDAVVVPQLLRGAAGAPYGLFEDLLTSAIPDREARAEAARRRLGDAGIPATSIVDGGFLSERPFLHRDLEGSVALQGARNTLVFSLARRERRTIPGSLAAGAVPSPEDDVVQRGINAAWAYRITPLTTLTLVGTSLRTEGIGLVESESRQRFASLTLSTRLGPRTTASMGVRRTDLRSDTATDFTENAIFATVAYRH